MMARDRLAAYLGQQIPVSGVLSLLTRSRGNWRVLLHDIRHATTREYLADHFTVCVNPDTQPTVFPVERVGHRVYFCGVVFSYERKDNTHDVALKRVKPLEVVS